MRHLGLLPLCLLSACAILPQEGTRAKLRDMPAFTQTLTSNDQSVQIVRAWPHQRWWRIFGSAQLNRLIEIALQDNPELKAVKARLIQAEALADFQAAEMLPVIGASVELHHRRFSVTDFYGPNGGKTFTGAYLDPVVFRYHLDLWGKDQAALEAALGKERAQASELAMASLMLSARIARSYIRLCTAEENIHLAHELTEKADQLTHLSELRWKRGLSSQDPIHANRQQLQAAKQREISARTRAHLLRNQLATLAGQGPDWGSNIIASENHTMAYLPMPEALSLGLLAHRPDVAAALWRVEAAAQMVKIAKTNFYPDINLVGFAGLRSLNLKDLFLSHGASVAYGIGPTLSLPIFEGGRLDAELKNQQAAYDAAVETYNETLLNAVQQVADSLAEWRQTQAHDEAQAEALEAAETETSLAEKRYQAGLSPLDDLVSAETARLKQRMTTSELNQAHQLAAISLIEALGGGYHDSNLNVARRENKHDK